ncbi:MAG: hypothetical protein WBN68_05595 [Sedimenticolaceae bacterium]
MSFSAPRTAGKADPFGLLILAVILALTITIAIQAQASAPYDALQSAVDAACAQPTRLVRAE